MAWPRHKACRNLKRSMLRPFQAFLTKMVLSRNILFLTVPENAGMHRGHMSYVNSVFMFIHLTLCADICTSKAPQTAHIVTYLQRSTDQNIGHGSIFKQQQKSRDWTYKASWSPSVSLFISEDGWGFDLRNLDIRILLIKTFKKWIDH